MENKDLSDSKNQAYVNNKETVMDNLDNWEVWGKHVLMELKSLHEGMEDIKKELARINIDLATLKVKSGVWGALGALIPITIGLVIWLITK